MKGIVLVLAVTGAALYGAAIGGIIRAHSRPAQARTNRLAGHVLDELSRVGDELRWKCACGHGDIAPTVDDALDDHWSHAEAAVAAAVEREAAS